VDKVKSPTLAKSARMGHPTLTAQELLTQCTGRSTAA
jgi:hypothetical protein